MIDLKQSYIKGKSELLENACDDNKEIFTEFFKYLERKLKRINQLSELDYANYKTLVAYVQRFRNVEKWFKGKSWYDLTKQDIKKVYDNLEDGIIVNEKGKPFKSKTDYYNKIFKSKPFDLAGKKEIAREVIEYSIPAKKDVRFLREEDFKKITLYAINPTHKLLLWLAWDFGENINSLLQLRKSDFTFQKNSDTNEDEYRVNLHKDILKRSRRSRGELTLYSETVVLLKEHLDNLQDSDKLFNFEYRNAVKFLETCCAKAKVKVVPTNEKVTWKDFRSGSACKWLSDGWSVDEIKNRLGHTPSSDAIDKYVNFLALHNNKPKTRVRTAEVNKLKDKLEQFEQREKMRQEEMQNTQKQFEAMQEQIAKLQKALDVKQIVKERGLKQ